MAALLLSACSPPAEFDDGLQVEVADATTYLLRVQSRSLTTVKVSSTSLDRLDADRHPDSGAIVAVIHHGELGGASLRLLGPRGHAVTLLTAAAPDDLGAPRWSLDGHTVAVVLQHPPTLTNERLRPRGELILLTPGSGRHENVTGVDDAAEALGWDAQGRLLFSRHDDPGAGRGDLHGARRLARLEPRSGRVEALPSADTRGAPLLYDPQLRGDHLTYLRSERPIVTHPAPDQRLELVLADLEGRPEHVVPLQGELPARPALRLGELVFALEGEASELGLDLHDGAVQRRLRRIPRYTPSPAAATLSSLSMPYVHQVYDTPNSFNGNWACGPTSTLMAIQHFGRLAKWPITVNVPSAHTSDYGAYVSNKYTAFGSTFDRVQNDASGKPAQGAYGWCTDGGGAWAWRMQDYAKKHNLKSDFTATATFSAIQSALGAGKVVVLSTQLTSAGHLITVKGTTSSGSLVVNDPYGDRNLPSYPNTKGEGVTYTWTQVKAKWMITVHGAPSSPTYSYKASLVDKSYPATLISGATAAAWIKYKNEGTATWDTSKTRLGTTGPQDRTSAFYDAGSWLSVNRAAAASAAAKPGESAKFAFSLAAPTVCKETTYQESFNLLQESVAWFSDSAQGGPKDTDLTLTIKVSPADADGDGSALGCGDCDDTDAAVYPGAAERCNGKDDDCDGAVDEGCAGADGGAGSDAWTGSDAGVRSDALLPPGADADDSAASETEAVLQGGCALGGVGGAGGRPAGAAPLLLFGFALLVLRRKRVAAASAAGKKAPRRGRVRVTA